MNIDKVLKDVGNYFKQKILSGDFEFKNCSDQTATVLIDGKYVFHLWIANEPKYNFEFHSHLPILGQDDYFKFKTSKERLLGWSKIKPYVKAYKQRVLKREKQKQINRLQKELDKLK